MPKLKRSDSAPLDGEILPPARVATASIAELSPEAFLAAHGVAPPRVKSYSSLDAALRAVIRDAVKGTP